MVVAEDVVAGVVIVVVSRSREYGAHKRRRKRPGTRGHEFSKNVKSNHRAALL